MKANPAQLSLPDQRRADVESGAARVRNVLKGAVDSVGREAVCRVSGVDPSSLTKILDGRGMNIPAELLAAVIQLDDDRRLAGGLADLAAADILPRRSEPLEQENARLRAKLRALHDEIESLLGAR